MIINNNCNEIYVQSTGIIIFGASGDLTHRKLLPSLFNIYCKKYIDNFFILGCARTVMTDDEYRQKVSNSIKNIITGCNEEQIKQFTDRCFYIAGDYNDNALYQHISTRLSQLDQNYLAEQKNHIFYMATPPNLYYPITNMLGHANLHLEDKKNYTRIIYEKPYGRDLTSAVQLDNQLHSVLTEKQIYRIDHYLGKETVQNILMFRFANSLFEPIWNQHFIDHVQITVAESLGIENRAGYYDEAGQLRDMFQNHMIQMLNLVAIEPPTSFNADRVRDETAKLLRAIEPFFVDDPVNPCIIRSQYTANTINDKKIPGYREEQGVPSQSETETFIAAKLLINNWRWKGVPFYLRSGKRLPKKSSEIAIVFKQVPHSMFHPLPVNGVTPNVLILNVYPDEGITLRLQAKKPGPSACLTTIDLNFSYQEMFKTMKSEPYERLLLDCMLGDQTLFWRYDGIELAWSLITPVLDCWKVNKALFPLTFYPAGTWGPAEADKLLTHDHRSWLNF